ncbi:rCG43432 [Rattus norvegicus]|uniref:RCG43432 n=1 Tax=Rattus norvegicus TaxID=10116 RepID=A6JJ50_RAT|nr:rCG43432 [Rattus norvegicus]
MRKCDGPCSSFSSCNQSCAWNFRGEIVFTCNQNKWQKTIETCTSLSVEALFQNYGKMANHILGPTAISNWAFIPNKNASSDLLDSVNSFAKKLQIHGKSESVVDELFIQTKGSRISHGTSGNSLSLSVPRYNATEDVLVLIEIPRQALQELSSNTSQAIAVAFPTLGAILKEVHQPNSSLQKPINDLILSLVLPEGLNEIILTFDKINKSQSTSSQCVSWDAEERQWDESPCTVMSDINSTVKCRCRHNKAVMSFSILMSSKPVKDMILNRITFIGLSVSIFSLVLCLVIEAIVWSRVVVTEISYMRHVCIVNIAVSLLTANVWFIIGSNFSANAQEDHKWCVAVTFFCHFFFLSLFFWMLFKALLIVYGILVVFRRMMKSRMMAIGFAIGYGCPLVIAVITVSVTEPGEGYTRRDACWLNWNQTKALFAFAIPALAIVAVNLLVVLGLFILLFGTIMDHKTCLACWDGEGSERRMHKGPWNEVTSSFHQEQPLSWKTSLCMKWI